MEWQQNGNDVEPERIYVVATSKTLRAS